MAGLRNILAFPVASLVAGVAYAAMNSIDGADAVVFLPAVGIATVIALVHAVVLGLPIALALKRLGKLKLPYVLTSAFLIGALPLPVILLATNSVKWDLREVALSVGFCGIVGLLAGYVWFYVADLSSNTSLERTREG
jgi:hypothetical protein